MSNLPIINYCKISILLSTIKLFKVVLRRHTIITNPIQNINFPVIMHKEITPHKSKHASSIIHPTPTHNVQYTFSCRYYVRTIVKSSSKATKPAICMVCCVSTSYRSFVQKLEFDLLIHVETDVNDADLIKWHIYFNITYDILI